MFSAGKPRNSNLPRASCLTFPTMTSIMATFFKCFQQVSQEVPILPRTSCLTFPTMTSVTAIYFKCFQQVRQEVPIYQELLGLLPGYYQEFLGQPGSSWVNQ